MANELQSYLNRVNPDDSYAREVEEAIRRSLPDSGVVLDGNSDANLFDYSRLIIGMIFAAATKGGTASVADLTINGATFTIDAGTNAISSHQNADAIADGILLVPIRPRWERI